MTLWFLYKRFYAGATQFKNTCKHTNLSYQLWTLLTCNSGGNIGSWVGSRGRKSRLLNSSVPTWNVQHDIVKTTSKSKIKLFANIAFTNPYSSTSSCDFCWHQNLKPARYSHIVIESMENHSMKWKNETINIKFDSLANLGRWFSQGDSVPRNDNLNIHERILTSLFHFTDIWSLYDSFFI